jgi:hypothetical protein
MIKKGLRTLPIIFFLLAFAFIGRTSAQSLYFAVPTEVVNVTITQQGAMAIDYMITFDNTHGGDVIDMVDIALPNQNYVLSSITADVNGNAISVEKGDPQYIAIGVTLSLGSYAIQPGQTGTVHLSVGEVDRVLYPYTSGNVKDYVSFEFSPNTFGSSYVTGSTDLTLSLHLPTGIQTNEPIYYTPTNGWPGTGTPQSSYDDQGRVTYTWESSQADVVTDYMFGGAFPAKYVPASSIVHPSIFDQLGTWFASLQINPAVFINCLIWGGCAAVFIAIVILGSVSSRKRKLQYLPPKISIEGHGIKRGLTAVEVAILMEQPMDKVMTMTLFSVIKKSAATVITRDPLKIEVTKPAPEGLRQYETDFLAAFDAPEDQRKTKLMAMIVALVKSVSDSMKGFSRKETLAYYQDIMTKAWAEVEAAGTPDLKGQKFDENMDWTMLDKDFDNRTRNVFVGGPVFIPIWWGRFDPVYRSSVGGMPAATVRAGSSGGMPSVSMPHLPGSDFAASIINGSSAFAAGTVGNVAAFTSGVTKVTNPVPVSTSSGGGYHGGGGGGHSCACACACAGCACACAGGGR